MFSIAYWLLNHTRLPIFLAQFWSDCFLIYSPFLNQCFLLFPVFVHESYYIYMFCLLRVPLAFPPKSSRGAPPPPLSPSILWTVTPDVGYREPQRTKWVLSYILKHINDTMLVISRASCWGLQILNVVVPRARKTHYSSIIRKLIKDEWHNQWFPTISMTNEVRDHVFLF